MNTYTEPTLDDALAERNQVLALGEPCPCAARVVVPNRVARRTGGVVVLSVDIEHEDDRAVIAPERERYLRRWSG